jgi:threonine dehydratase
MMKDLPVTVAAVRDAAAAIAEAIAGTPLIAAPALSEVAGTEIHLKIETQHRTGSFKERGALAKLLTLDASQGSSRCPPATMPKVSPTTPAGSGSRRQS